MKKPLITPHKALQHFGTQAKLARALGVTQQAVSKWKLAREMPEPMQRLAMYTIRDRTCFTAVDTVVMNTEWPKRSKR